jgi:transketolase
MYFCEQNSFKMATTQELKDFSQQVRRDILRMVHAVNSGHPGGSLGCTEFLTVLYQEIMEYSSDVFDMDGKNEDLFFLSNGHISPVFYSVLARSGYFSVSELATFRKLNSRLQGHPTTHEGLEGIRMASGSLGQGMSVAIGAAQAKKLNGDSKTVFFPSRRWRVTRRSKLGSHHVCIR